MYGVMDERDGRIIGEFKSEDEAEQRIEDIEYCYIRLHRSPPPLTITDPSGHYLKYIV